MSEADNIATVRQFSETAPAEQDAPRRPFFADEAAWHVPGNNPVSGDYRGVEAITSEIGRRVQPLDRWTLSPSHIMANGEMVVAIVHVEGERRGKTIPATAHMRSTSTLPAASWRPGL